MVKVIAKKTAARLPEPQVQEKIRPEDPRETVVPKIDPSRLRRKKPEQDDDTPPEKPKPVSAGTVDKSLDLAFNPSDEMLPSVTIIDRTQGRLFPVIEIINIAWSDVMEVAYYRQNKDEYRKMFGRPKPVSLNWLSKLLHHTAMWQKSVGGTNLTKITDIALADIETRSGDDGDNSYGGTDAWGKD
jgi:hypothetical protein